MPFTIACPNCDAKLKATDALVGKTIKCPRCSKPVLIQQPKPSAVASAPRLELPPSTPVEEEPAQAEFVDEEPAPPRTGQDEIVDQLPEVDDQDEEVVDAELNEAMPAGDDYDRPRRPKPRRAGGVTPEERQAALFIYLLSIFTHFIGPLILWMMKRDESKFIDHHGKEVLNFSITIGLAALILSAVGVPLVFLTCGLGAFIYFPLILALGVYATVMTIIGAMRANNGEWYEFPLSFRMIK